MVTLRRLMIATALGLATWAAAVAVALAQTPAPPASQESTPEELQGGLTSDIELTRAAIQVRRQAIVTASMDLESREADGFWPLYREYRLAMATVNDRFVKLLGGYLESYDKLTDEAAGKMMDEYLGIERARLDVKKKYVARFGKLLPTKKVARFFQIDGKLDAMINAELAQLVPLAR
jgi:hypothetical protein